MDRAKVHQWIDEIITAFEADHQLGPPTEIFLILQAEAPEGGVGCAVHVHPYNLHPQYIVKTFAIASEMILQSEGTDSETLMGSDPANETKH